MVGKNTRAVARVFANAGVDGDSLGGLTDIP
jgi:hypothetical protein